MLRPPLNQKEHGQVWLCLGGLAGFPIQAGVSPDCIALARIRVSWMHSFQQSTRAANAGAPGVSINAILPWTFRGLLHAAQGLPHSAIALKSTAKCNLPHPMASAHPPFGLNVGKLVPD
ncbi:hypothetical protein IEQ34_020497 [Dendrobium chrysotoxum]|uniref:Uncharacterized protein n=1 Tax=Dendrobium chrysotoxum TaxID=161865 RepID=A0AAV7FKJ4_DENCH|nr:hypothetical protein IEQ34_020497 [Dendrobium chrysotoxum]